MKGFPKVIKTKSDLVNTFKLVQKKKLKKEDWLAAVEKLENQNWIMCPVIELSEDRKTVKIMFCAEVAAGQKIKNGAVYPTVQAVETVEVEKDTTEAENAATEGQEAATEGQEAATEGEAAAGQNNTTTFTVLTLSKAVNIGTVTIGIPAAVTFYDRMGITEEEVEEMKGALA
jgi:hypothetical protein